MSFKSNTQPNGETSGTAAQALDVLVSGASFAGLTTAFWMNRLGYNVTVVEINEGLKRGGSPVDIKERTVDIMKRMGLLKRIKASSLKAKAIDFVDVNGTPIARLPAQAGDGRDSSPEYEIERDTLLQMMFEAVEGDVEFLFDDSIARLDQSADQVAVTFKSGKQRSFSLVFGCDGNHSSVRRMCFGEESAYSHFLHKYSSITIADKLLIEGDTAQMYNVPGKAVMVSAYNNKTDIIFCFHSENEIPYSYRDQQEQRGIILQQFSGEGWRTPELLEEMARSTNFYFDKMCQIRMPSWTKGRVALVGDAGYALPLRQAWEDRWQLLGQPLWPTRSRNILEILRRHFRSTTTTCAHSSRTSRRRLSTLGWRCLFRHPKKLFKKETRSSALSKRAATRQTTQIFRCGKFSRPDQAFVSVRQQQCRNRPVGRIFRSRRIPHSAAGSGPRSAQPVSCEGRFPLTECSST